MRALSSLAVVAGLGLASTAQAQTYPSSTVQVIVPYAAGGPIDAIIRGLAQRLSERWGQPVIVDNRPGANEVIAANVAAKAAPDGHTLMLVTDPTLSHNPFLFAKLPYDPDKDFVPVTRLVDVNMVLVVPASLPIASVQEFVAHAKANGDKLNYGSAGQGNTTHIAMEWFKSLEGFSMTHVPYKGVAPALNDMLGGNIEALFCAVSGAEPHVRAGKLKALAISGQNRSPALPDVPTFAEAGVANFEATFYIGLVAPAGTPSAILQQVATASREIMAEPEFRARFIDPFGFETVGSTPEEFADFVKRDRELAEKKIEISGVKHTM